MGNIITRMYIDNIISIIIWATAAIIGIIIEIIKIKAALIIIKYDKAMKEREREWEYSEQHYE